jgi:hypothetical protein
MTSSIRTTRSEGRHHRLGADTETPHTSRDLARAALTDPRWAVDAGTRSDVVMVVNELVTASYLAGATTIDLDLEVFDDRVTVIVRDDRPLGRGLPAWGDRAREMLLDAVCTSRSVSHDADGTENVAHVLFRPPAVRERHLHVVR